jgi:large subunit ribosomal protein L15
MNINEVNTGVSKNRRRKRIGRGTGSGTGKTSGRGHKGQGSRRGSSAHPVFQGGTMPLVRRVAKRGFNNKFAKEVAVVNVGQLDEAFADGDEVSVEVLVEKNLARGHFDQLKVLGEGDITKKLNITAHRFSKTAVEKIEKAGGSTVVLPGKKPVVKNKMRVKKQK